MKIAILAPEVFPVPPVRGGAVETAIEEVSAHFEGHDVHIFSVGDEKLPDREKKGKRTYYRYRAGLWGRLLLSSWKLPFKRSSSPLYYRPYSQWACSYLKKIQPDIVWVHSRIQFVPLIRKSVPDARIILSLHNESNLKGDPVWGWNFIDSCDSITSCSAYLAGQLEAARPRAAGKSEVLYNGVDPEVFTSIWDDKEKRASLRRENNLEDSVVILYVGRLVQEKGAHLLISAFKETVKMVPQAKLIIVGAHTFSDGRPTPYIDQLRKDAVGFEDKIAFAGHVPRETIRDYFLMSDILAFPSVWKEPFGMTLIEGMSSGLPVVAFGQGGPSEIVENGRSGILIPVDQGEGGFRRAFTFLAHDAAERESLGRAARKTIEERFTWKAAADKFLRLANNLMQRDVRVLIAETGTGYGGTAKYLSGLLPLLENKWFSIDVVSSGDGPFIKEVEKQGWPVTYRPSWRFPWEIKPGIFGMIPCPGVIRQAIGYSAYLIAAAFQIVWLVPKISGWLKKKRIKIVHLNNEVLSHLPLLIAAHLSKCHVICHLHGWRPFTRLERALLPWVDELISISDAGAKYFMSQLDDRKVTPIPNGLAISGELKDFESKRAALRHELGLTEDRIVITLPGRLVPWKGQEIFIKAIAQLTADRPEIAAVILGHDPDPTQQYLNRLKQLCRQHGIESSVYFLPFQEDVWAVYAASDIIVHASVKPEPFGLVILEAMFAKRPVVATRGGGVTDLVIDEVTGLLAEPGDPDSMAAALKRYLENPQYASEVSAQAERRAKNFFTMNRNAAKVAEVYAQFSGKKEKDDTAQS